MPDVFISYSREDQAIARCYAEALEREGFDVWWDVALSPGETFDKVTEQALRESSAVVVLWSRHSVDSRWVRSEATQADRYGTLLPVMIEPCERPILFELAHTVDLSHWKGDPAEARWQEFIGSVRRFVDKAVPADARRPPAPTRVPAAAPSSAPAGARRPGMGWVVAVVAILAGAVVAVRGQRERPVEEAQLMRFAVAFDDNARYTIGEDFVRSASISPDGKRVVFTGSDRATGTARLFIRRIDSEEATPLAGGEDGTEPFWSPDSRSVGFYAGGKVRIAGVDGTPARELTTATSAGGASWNDRGQILISLKNPGPLMRVPAAGGTPEEATVLEEGEFDHDWPQFLDDGNHFLYMSRGRTAATNKVYLASLDSPGRTLLLEGVPAFAHASPDRLIYLSSGTLLSQQLDVKQASLVGTPVALAERALPPFSASRTGALTFRTVPARPNPLVWTRTDGTVIGEAAPPGYYTDPQISPDGKLVALAMREAPDARYDVAIMDVGTKALRKLTLNPADDRAPVWSPDGRSIVYLSFRPDAPGLYRRSADGAGEEELILASRGVVWPYQWTRRGLYFFDGVSGSNDVGVLTGEGLRDRMMLVESPANDVDGTPSPDGKWLAYTSNASGRWELYVTTVDKSGTRLQVTTEGGCDPTWSRDGSLLFYTRPSTAELMSIPVTPGDPPTFGQPRRLHPGPLDYPSAHSLDVDPDGERLLLAPSPSVQGDLTVLVNWQATRSD